MGKQAGLLERLFRGIKAKTVGPREKLVEFPVGDERGVADSPNLGRLLNRPPAGIPLINGRGCGFATENRGPNGLRSQPSSANRPETCEYDGLGCIHEGVIAAWSASSEGFPSVGS